MAGIEIVAKDNKGNVKQEYEKKDGRVIKDKVAKPEKKKK